MQPYYDEDGMTIYHADCRDALEHVGNGHGCVVITDPPYGLTSLKWDRWIDGWPGMLAANELWSFGSMRMFLDHAAEFDTWKFGQDVVWEKHNGSSFHADRFRRVHESVLQFYRGPWQELPRKVPTTASASRRTVRRKERPPHMGEIEGATYTSLDGGPLLMTTVQYVRSMHGDAVHPTQKPIGILLPILEYTGTKRTVLDPFMGSGSTLVAAKHLNRKAIGIEVDEHYCEVAALRLAQGVLV